MRQQQFLKVLTEAEANAKFDAAFATLPIRQERVALDDALGRVLAEDVTAPVDVPAFDRSNMDGFAVRAADTFGASEGEPLTLTQLPGARAAGPVAAAERDREIGVGEVLAIATGGAIPRGADAVCMVEHTEAHPEREGAILLERSVTPGENISATGSDLARGEVVCRRGVTLTSRETGLIAAVGVPEVLCLRKPRVAVLSTGNEVQAPGRPLALGQVYDSNRRIVSDAVREAGGEPIALPTLPDEEEAVRARLTELVTGEDPVDLIVLSGGTSKGQGDLNHRVISALARELVSEGDGPKGMLVHGVALKPGKPLCLAMVNGRPVVVLPGFPTSAIFTFQTFVVPRLRRLSGLGAAHHSTLEAAAAVSIPGAAGRTRYALVTVVEGESGPVVYPLGAGSGSVRTFSRADGYVSIPQHTTRLEAGSNVTVRTLSREVVPKGLVAIGSHCIGLDALLSELSAQGFSVHGVPVGSRAGLDALRRGEGDLAGVHLLDPATGEYNRAFVPEGCRLLPGYLRDQGIVHRPGDKRFEGLGKASAENRRARLLEAGRMVNRNRASGTRALIDQLLGPDGKATEGYRTEHRNHHAVAAAVAQGRADWGVTLECLALASKLSFIFLTQERYDFIVRVDRWERPAVKALRALLASPRAAALLAPFGFAPVSEPPQEAG